MILGFTFSLRWAFLPTQFTFLFVADPIVSPYLLAGEASLNLRTLMTHQPWQTQYSLSFSGEDGFTPEQLLSKSFFVIGVLVAVVWVHGCLCVSMCPCFLCMYLSVCIYICLCVSLFELHKLYHDCQHAYFSECRFEIFSDIEVWISRIPEELREFLETCGSTAHRALVVAQLFGDQGEIDFWTVACHYLTQPALTQSKVRGKGFFSYSFGIVNIFCIFF